MTKSRIRRYVAVGLLVAPLLSLGSVPAALAEWPEQPIKITIPWPAGAGAVDQMTRALQRAVSEENLSPQPITVFNVGGHFSIGLRQAKDQEPDGYNFVVMHMAMMTGQASGVLDFGYKDFDPVVRLGSFCLLQAVTKESDIASIDELLSKAAMDPDTLVFGANLGAINHIFGIMVQDLNPGAKFRFVQTGGDAKTYPAMAGGHVSVGGFSAAGAVNFTRTEDGMANPDSPVLLLAYAGSQRHDKMSEVPTFKELGFDFEFCVDGWYFAPKGTPQEAIDGFAAIVERALGVQSLQEFLAKKAMVGRYQAGDELRAEMDRQWEAISPVAARAKSK